MRLKPEIMEKVVQVDFEQNRDVDVENILLILPLQLQSDIIVYKEKLEEEGRKIEVWLSENLLPMGLKSEIMEKVVQPQLEQNRVVDVTNVRTMLPNQLQIYMESYMRKMREKEKEIDMWLFKNCIDMDESELSDVMKEVGVEVEKDGDVDVEIFLSVYQRKAGWIMPLDRLKKLKLLEKLDERVVKQICEHLKRVDYLNYRSVLIVQGQPPNLVIVTDRFTYMDYKNQILGQELLVWPSSSSFPAVLPKATETIVPDIEVLTTLVLTAGDMEIIGSKFKPQFDLLASHWVTWLKQVPKLRCMDEQMLKDIFMHLKQDFEVKSYCKQNEPIRSMHFTIEGSILFKRNNEEFFGGEGEVFGEELLDWVLDTSFPAVTPLATLTACSTQSGAAVLSITAEELKSVASKFVSHFTTFRKKSQPDLLTFVGLPLLKKVPQLENLDDEVLRAICQHLRVRMYSGDANIVVEGQPLDRVLFLLRGTLYTDDGCVWYGESGQFFGEELIDWIARPSGSEATRPLSKCTMSVRSWDRSHFLILMASDLESVVTKFKSHFS